MEDLLFITSGCAAVSLRKGLFVIDNTTNGFILYHLDTPDPMSTFITDLPTVPVLKQVIFGKDSKIVVGGSNNGSVYIYEQRSGRVLETLRHADKGLVQTISVSIHAHQSSSHLPFTRFMM